MELAIGHFFNRIGILIQNRSNIIIRNIRFTMIGVPISKTDENKVIGWRNGAAVVLSDPDCISIQADSGATSYAQKLLQESRNIWIDHNEFYNEDPLTSTFSKDRYDGLLDAKNKTYNVTVSWNYFHDHSKGALIGNSTADSFEHKFTFHHNYFRNIESRQPMIRYGRAHLFNNFFTGNADGSGNGTDVRVGSDLFIEANHYDQLSKGVFGSEGGQARFANNKWTWTVNKMRVPENLISEAPGTNTVPAIAAGSFTVPYSYSSVMIPVNELATTVSQWAGIGKINTSPYEQPTAVRSSQFNARVPQKIRDGNLIVHTIPGQPSRYYSILGQMINP